MSVQLRPFQSWLLIPPFPGLTPETFSEHVTPEFLWDVLGARSEVADKGRALFHGSLSQRNLVWKQFRNFVRQARAYYTGAENVSGSSAALLYYYAFLNLAKAELLRVAPGIVGGRDLRHGLLFRAPGSGELASGSVEVTSGVFPMLYKSRTGHSIKPGTRFPVRRLLAAIPEIGWEFGEAGLGVGQIGGVMSAIAIDGGAMWGLLMLQPNDLLDRRGDLRRSLDRAFDEVDLPAWRDIFAVSRRNMPSPSSWQQRTPKPRTFTTAIHTDDIHAACRDVWAGLSPYVDHSTDPGLDALLCPSLYRSRPVPMPASLARYATMFYLSSVVRYRPELLDDREYASAAWLANRVPRETAICLLLNAVSGIEGRPYVFAGAKGTGRS
jgi:hypothetical protein